MYLSKIFFYFFIACLLFFVSCKNQEKNIHSGIIDIEQGLQNLTRLKTSDFGKTIRYIPLETTNDGLVGRNPVVKVLRDYIVVEYGNQYSAQACLLFHKDDGRFIAEVGHSGQDPESFTSHFSWTDETETFLYFQRSPNQLVKYDMQGNYGGNVRFSTSSLASYYLLNDSEIIGYFGGMNQQGKTNSFSIGFFDRDGILIDSIPSLFPETTPMTPDEVVNANILTAGGRGREIFGIWGYTGTMILNYKNDRRQVIASNAARIWKHDGNIRFKEEFVDTLYTISDRKLVPSIVFNTGKYHWPVEERLSTKNTNERIFIADISENNTFVFFQCIKGMNSDAPVLYTGLYNKHTGKTRISNNSDAIEDDLTHFIPFTPLGLSTSGEFVSLVEAYKIMEWMEEHPEAKNNEKLTFLKGLDGEMNPVVILIE